MAIRLTQYIREEIRDSIVSPAFDLRTNSLKCSEQSLAQRAYSTLVSQSQQATMNTLPQSVFAWRSNVMISARRGSETIRLLGVNREAWQTLQLESPVACQFPAYRSQFVFGVMAPVDCRHKGASSFSA